MLIQGLNNIFVNSCGVGRISSELGKLMWTIILNVTNAELQEKETGPFEDHVNTVLTLLWHTSEAYVCIIWNK